MLTKHQLKTPLKTNMERENHLFERNIIFQTFILGFHVGVLVFWRVGDMYMLPPHDAYLFTLRELPETTPENGSISSVDFSENCFTQRTKHLILSIPLLRDIP